MKNPRVININMITIGNKYDDTFFQRQSIGN